MIPQCLVFMRLVPTLQRPCEAALAIQTATTINMTQCRISACHLDYPSICLNYSLFCRSLVFLVFPQSEYQEERVEVSLELSTQCCIFGSQLHSSKLQHQSGSKALPTKTGKGRMVLSAQDPVKAQELGAGPGRGAAVRC